MPELDPLRGALKTEADEARVKRMWDRIEERRGPRLPVERRLGLTTAAVVLAAAAVALVVVGPGSIPGADEGGPVALTQADGSPLTGRLGDGVTSLADRSSVDVATGGHVDVLESSPRAVGFALRSGRADFTVTPGGPRAWRVECGDVTVEVVGTVFSVDREGARVEVAVERGSVLVRGPRVPDRVQRLEAGQGLVVEPPEPAQEPAAPATAAVEVAPPRSAPEPAPAPAPGVAPAPRPAPSRPGPLDPVGDLLSAADRERAAGRPADAVPALEAVIRDHADDPRAALAAYSLARLRLGPLGQPSQAARDYERSLVLGLPGGLAEAARAGRVTALGRAGDARVDAAAREYLEAHPDGRYRAEVARWVVAR
jgi:transmembrane sensor